MKKNNDQLGWLGLPYVVLILLLFFIYGLIRYDENVLEEFVTIITSPSILITDYLAIAGFSATLLNVILMSVFNLALIKICKVKVRGVTFAAFFIVFGFGFFGKNIVNILPIYFGTYLFSRVEKEKFSKYLVIAMFATGLAPIVSFGFDGSIYRIILGIVLGIVYGFIIPTFSGHVIRFHNGYSLYNIGFAGGVFAILAYGVLNIFGIENETLALNTNAYSTELEVLLFAISALYLILALISRKRDKSYKKLLSMSGRAITDFTMIFGKRLTYFNAGIVGMLTLVVIMVTRVPMNGIIFGAASTVIGFAAFGKHPKNIVPVMLGALVTGVIVNGEITEAGLVIALFSTTLAPIAGDFGFVAGVIAGTLHFSIATNTADWQGGMNLYNNGFASGFVAAIMGSVLDTIEFKNIFRIRGNKNESL